MPWPGAYSTSDKCPALEKGPAIQDYTLCAHYYTVENLAFVDTPVHSYTHTRGDHARIHNYNDGTHFECTTNYGFTHVSFVQNVAHVRLFSSRAREFLNQENFCQS